MTVLLYITWCDISDRCYIFIIFAFCSETFEEECKSLANWFRFITLSMIFKPLEKALLTVCNEQVSTSKKCIEPFPSSSLTSLNWKDLFTFGPSMPRANKMCIQTKLLYKVVDSSDLKENGLPAIYAISSFFI